MPHGYSQKDFFATEHHIFGGLYPARSPPFQHLHLFQMLWREVHILLGFGEACFQDLPAGRWWKLPFLPDHLGQSLLWNIWTDNFCRAYSCKQHSQHQSYVHTLCQTATTVLCMQVSDFQTSGNTRLPQPLRLQHAFALGHLQCQGKDLSGWFPWHFYDSTDCFHIRQGIFSSGLDFCTRQ